MTNPVTAPYKAALRCLSSLEKPFKNSANPEVQRLVVALLALSMVLPTCMLAAEAQGSRNTGLKYHQRLWNQANPFSKTHDAQPRPNADCEGEPVIHQSRPAPDRTMQRFYIFTMPPQKQR